MFPAPAVRNTIKTLIFVPQASLASLVPMWTSVQPTQNIGFRIDDVSFCRDQGMNPKPQMQAGHVLEDDGRRRIMMLRDGLWFHDGQKVLAHNCLTVVATMNVA